MFPWPFRLRSPLFLPFLGLACGEACCYYAVLGMSEDAGAGGWEALAAWGRLSWILVGIGAMVMAVSGRRRVGTWGKVGLWMACGGLGIAAISPALRLSLPPSWTGARHWTCVVESSSAHRFGGYAAQAVCLAAGHEGQPTRVEFVMDDQPSPGMVYRGWGQWIPWREEAAFNERGFRNALGFSGKLDWIKPPSCAPGPPPRLWQRIMQPLSSHFAQARLSLRELLDRHSTPASQGLLWGLATGDKSLLPTEVKQRFSAVGLSHVLAVSGYHVGLVGMLAFAFARSRWPAVRWLAAPGLVGVWWYVGLCGFPVSAVRAALMSSFFVLGCWMRRPMPGLQMWSLAGWCVAWWMPLAAVQIGAQLSFLAVLGIFLGLEVARSLPRHRLRRIGQATVVPLSAQSATSPLTAVAFGTFPTYFLPVNLVAGPWVTAIGYGLGLGCIGTLWLPESGAWVAWIWWGVNALTEALMGAVAWASSLPGASWDLTGWNALSGWVLGAFFMLAALSYVRRNTQAAQILGAGSAIALAGLPWTWTQEIDVNPHVADAKWALVRSGTPALLWREESQVIPLVADSSGWERMNRWQQSKSLQAEPLISLNELTSRDVKTGGIQLAERHWVGWLPDAFWSLEWDRKGMGKWTVYALSKDAESDWTGRWTPWVAWHPTLDTGAPWHSIDAQELGHHLVHIALPLGNIGDG